MTENYIKNKQRYSVIENAPIKDYYYLSSAQTRLFFLNQFDKDSVAYNMPQILRLEQKIDFGRLNQVFTKLIERHDSFRTSFEIIDELPVQRIHKHVEFKVERYLLGEKDEDSFKKNFIKAFDLSKAPLLRVALVEFIDGGQFLMIDMHHIISDGTSLGILKREFLMLYSGKVLEPFKLQYKDYSEWQNNDNQKDNKKELEQYWTEKFKGEIPILNLPLDFTRPAVQSDDGATVGFILDIGETDSIKSLARDNGITLYMAILSVFSILLSKLSGQDDIVIGTPIAGRNHIDLEKIVGMFVNTLALRIDVKGNTTVREFIKRIKVLLLDSFENQDYQFEDLVEKLSVSRDISRNPIFDVMFSMININEKPSDFAEFDNQNLVHNKGVSKFDLTLSAVDNGKHIVLIFEYSTLLFKPETVERFILYFKQIVGQLTKRIDNEISAIDILSYNEKRRLLYDFNDTSVDISSTKLIQEIFEDEVARNHNKIAVVLDDTQVSYGELNERANRLAYTLIEKGVKPNVIVGLFGDRSPSMIISLIAVLKAGGIFLPIDSLTQPNRCKIILNECNAELLLVQGDIASEIGFKGEVIDVENEKSYSECTSNPENHNRQDDLIYIIYTSGSSGRPKGVMIEHKNLINAHFAWKDKYELTSNNSNILQVASFGFDVFIGDISRSLMNGGKLIICPNEIRLEYELLTNILLNQRVHLFESTPALIIPFLDYAYNNGKVFKDLRLIIIGSDSLNAHDYFTQQERFGKSARIINSYGVTEATIDTSFYEEKKAITKDGNLPIGKPMPNMSFYVLNNLKLQPVNVVGELFIGGKGVARGYLNNPTLTAEKFIQNPYNQSEIIYRTGDLSRWLWDGNVEFLGRADNQVKIRGFRVELGEIENVLLKHKNVNDCLIQVIDRQGDKFICAYVVCEEKASFEELRAFLISQLPDYMIPSYFIQIDKVPISSNGKIDYKLLPLPEITAGFDYVAPSSRIEEIIVSIWADILHLPKQEISVMTNFFSLGGHSLKASVLVGRIYKEMGVNIPLRDLFIHATVRGQANLVLLNKKSTYLPIPKVEEKSFYRLSSAQKRLHLLQEMEPDSIAYNMPYMISLGVDVEVSKIALIFNTLIERHESLRTYFHLEGEELVQRIQMHVDFNVEDFLIDASEVEGIKKKFIQTFDLSKVPLLRVALVKIRGEGSLLMIDMHHMISDGISHSILEREFRAIYSGEELSLLKLQYKDYSEWLYDEVQQERIKKQENYWMDQFKDETPVLSLSIDYVRPAFQSHEGASVRFVLSQEVTDNIRSFAKENDLTLYMSLFSVFTLLLSNLSGQETIVIGTPIAGRSHPDLENIVGMFVNTLAIRIDIKGEDELQVFLEKLKIKILDAFENQEYQFEDLVDCLSVRRDTSRNPLFDVMFNLLNQKEYSGDLSLFNNQNPIHTSGISKFDLTLTAIDYGKQLLLNFEYCTKLFKAETVERYIQYFISLINQITINPDVKISELDIINDEEKYQLLNEFNSTDVDYPKEKTIIDIFEEQVKKTPKNIALIYGEEKETYQELKVKSDLIASYLQEVCGVMHGDLVGIMLEREEYLIPSIYGILKTGGAYVPIDPNYPIDRIISIVDDSKIKAIVTMGKFLKDSMQLGCRIVDLEKDLEVINAQVVKSSGIKVNSNNLAYVIYTSGSTGKPKGVMIEHHSIINRILWMQKVYGIDQNDVLLQKTPIVFDVSVWELFWWSFAGASLCLLKPGGEKEPDEIIKTIEKNNVTTIHFVPSMLGAFLSVLDGEFIYTRLSSLRQVFSSGEALKPEHVSLFGNTVNKNCGARLINLYGPTEATVDVSYFECEFQSKYTNVPIGKPIDNTQFYILNKSNHLVPLGVAGELCIAGVGLARGYINNEGLTRERFVENPYIKGKRIYRTGDLARWLPDGNIEFLGRIDHQVKIRGFRIELGEIESVLLNHQDIVECVVQVYENKGDKLLCAYLVCIGSINQVEIRNYLSTHLPDYMVPSYFVKLEKMPVNSNGKLDCKLLPPPEFSIGNEYFAPSNAVEVKLVEIWSKILNVPKESISRNSNFFDLGGHSLKLTLLVSKIHKEFNVKVSLAESYRFSELSQFAEYINITRKDSFVGIPYTEKREYYPLAKSQRGIFLYQKMIPESRNYNIPAIIPLNDGFDLDSLEKIFIQLIKRHEVLRTSFFVYNDEVYQRVYDEFVFSIPVYETNQFNLNVVLDKVLSSFCLEETPLIRACVLKFPNKKPSLIVNVHHIISDEFSLDLLIREFNEIINGKRLLSIKHQFKDFVVWQNQDKSFLERHELHKKYWLSKFNSGLPELNLPLDFPRKNEESFEGDSIRLILTSYETQKIQEIVKSHGTSTFITVLSIFYIWLMKLSGDEDIIVGTPISGRYHENLNNICGMFVNTIALRNHPEKNKNYTQFLTETHRNVLNDFENQLFSFDELVGVVCKERKLGKNPIFDVFYTFSNNHLESMQNNDNRVLKQEDIWTVGVKFDLFLSGIFINDQIALNIQYRKALFNKKSIDFYITILKEIINNICINQDVSLSEIASLENISINQNIVSELEENF